MDIIARPIYKLPVFGKVKWIEFSSSGKLIAKCEVNRQSKSSGEFQLIRTDAVDAVIIKFRDKLREEFQIVEKRSWTCEIPKSDSWISLAKPMTIKSEKLLGEFSNQGLIYLDDKCIGRIGKVSKYLFGRRHTKMEVKDETYINLLMSISLVKILQHKVYKIYDWGD